MEFIHSERWARLSLGDQPPSSGVVIFCEASSFATTSIRACHSRLIADINSALLPGTHSSSLIGHLLRGQLSFPVQVSLSRLPCAGSRHLRARESSSFHPL